MKKLFLFLLLAAMFPLSNLFAQAGEIYGVVLDENKEPVPNAQVVVLQGSIQKGTVVTDFDGNFSVKPLDSGRYDVRVVYLGYKDDLVEGVILAANGRAKIDFTIEPGTSPAVGVGQAGRQVAPVEIRTTRYKKPLIEPTQPGSRTVMVSEELNRMPSGNMMWNAKPKRGARKDKALNIAGGRSANTIYVVDGIVQSKPLQFNSSTEGYGKVRENEFASAKANPLSTLSVDVDRASYANVRRFINEGSKPPADAVRIEEMVNYFDYNYAGPIGADPVAIHTEVAACPWNPAHKILHVGLQARKVDTRQLPPSNLVFLVDVSGSMQEASKLPLVQASLRLLVNNLRVEDRVAMVVYAGSAGLVLPSTSGADKAKILAAIDALQAGGSTAGGDGILLAYKTATDNFIKGGNNRVILATDGDFNVGISSTNQLEDLIVKEREGGVFLTVLGYGTGNYQDEKMQVLADKGNGNHAYIDNLREAQKVLISEFGGTLFTVAKDVKAQVEFNPARVQGYRLIGYENRLLNEEDFKDDKKDAGEMGSGHTVTILYEIVPAGAKSRHLRGTDALRYGTAAAVAEGAHPGELATVKFRYKEPDGKVSKELSHPIADASGSIAAASENLRFSASVALFGMLLRESKFSEKGDYGLVTSLASGAKGADSEGYRAEFVQLVKAASGKSVSRR